MLRAIGLAVVLGAGGWQAESTQKFDVTLILRTRPRTGRTAAFAKCEVTITDDHMSGTIDTDKEKLSS